MTSINQSFGQKLPREPAIAFEFAGDYRDFVSTVATTIEADAMSVFIKEDVSIFDNIFRNHFPPAKPFSSINRQMPALEKSHKLSTEADVLRLSTMQLIHPVNMALEEITPPGTTIVCGTETHGGPGSRFDMQWSLYSDGGKLLKLLAVLEFKNTHVIHWRDFAPAVVTEDNHDVKLAKAFGQNEEHTLLQDNASWLSKQAGKYSKFCDDVAVFDWNAMFIFNYVFHRARGGPIRGTYFDEFGHTKGMTFRRLLFAFLARTLKRYEAINMRNPSV